MSVARETVIPGLLEEEHSGLRVTRRDIQHL